MDPFFTPVEIPGLPFSGGYDRKYVFIGSCFSENIGMKMQDLKFSTDINPFGILYNPLSASACIRRLISGEMFGKSELFYHDGLWHSFMHHGKFSSPSLQETLSGINERLLQSTGFLRKADFLILTFGTAWVFELKASGMIVSNCHKVPPSAFRRSRVPVSEIVSDMQETLELLRKINPAVRIIFTVSPVRHLKDGATGNQLSKAALLLAAETLVQQNGRDKCAYFPAYELMMDELRDYRYYAEDMVHPSPLAISHIWERFRDWFLDKNSAEIAGKVYSLLQARNHRPLNRDTAEYRTFARNQLIKIREMIKKYPFLDFSAEIEYFAQEAGSGSPGSGDQLNISNNSEI